MISISQEHKQLLSALNFDESDFRKELAQLSFSRAGLVMSLPAYVDTVRKAFWLFISHKKALESAAAMYQQDSHVNLSFVRWLLCRFDGLSEADAVLLLNMRGAGVYKDDAAGKARRLLWLLAEILKHEDCAADNTAPISENDALRLLLELKALSQELTNDAKTLMFDKPEKLFYSCPNLSKKLADAQKTLAMSDGEVRINRAHLSKVGNSARAAFEKYGGLLIWQELGPYLDAELPKMTLSRQSIEMWCAKLGGLDMTLSPLGDGAPLLKALEESPQLHTLANDCYEHCRGLLEQGKKKSKTFESKTDFLCQFWKVLQTYYKLKTLPPIW